jgi:cytochrome bd-type quinol oxidase subunit 2
MKLEKNNFKTKKKRLIAIAVIVVGILLVPLVAMQFTDQVNWAPSDFFVMAILLLGAGLACELVLRTVKNRSHQLIGCVLLLIAFFLIWAELAVGIFGSPFAGS